MNSCCFVSLFCPVWLLCVALGSAVFAQNSAQNRRIFVSEAIPLRNDYGYEIIGRMRDHILLFRDKAEDFEIQAFDNHMRPLWNRVLEDLDKNGMQILAVIGGVETFSVVFKQRRRGAVQLRVHKYDAGATRTDSVTLKTFGERMLATPELELFRSEDRNCIVVANMAERGRMETLCFRLDRLEVLWEKLLLLDDVYLDTNVRGMEVSNTGDFFMITEWNNRRSRLGAHEYQVLHVRADTNRIVRIPLPDFLTVDVKFIFDNLNQALVGSGFYGERNRDRANGVFYVRVPLRGEPIVRYESFSDRVISALRKKDVADDTKGIPYATVRQIVLRQDGGALLVAELFHEVQRGTLAGRGIWRDGMRLVMDYYYDDVLLITLNPNGSAHWMTVLHKKQYSQDDDALFSSFCLLRTPNRFHLLFNDEVKYENTCSEYIVTPLGEFDRNSLLNTHGQNLRLRFRDALQLNANECVVPSEFRNRLRLVLIKF